MNLIQTFIAIAMAAVALLVGVYYGGPLLNGGSTNALATTVSNAGSNVAVALQAYRTENPGVTTPAGGITDLTTGGYLNGIPQLDSVLKTGTAIQLHSTLGVVAAVESAAVCGKINSNLKVPSATINLATNAPAPALLTGCFKTDAVIGSAAIGDYVYFNKV